ncbi:chorismate-binding protein [Putridiphycobacter roseus]|uniref:chorismate-binding protein n=2 Tax=Putridiphycobacter roseus TaxID=2219161 RepID=UPI0013145FE9|nr:anthranilate synthase component I family protein [Putridiphycobacter roseus]
MKKYYPLNTKLDQLEIIQKLSLEKFCLLNNGDKNFILGWNNNVKNDIQYNTYQDISNLKLDKNYWFGFLTYDLKNKTLPKTKSKNLDIHHFPETLFFKASNVLIKKNNHILYFGENKDYLSLKHILSTKKIFLKKEQIPQKIELKASTSKKDYLNNVTKIKEQIQKGNTYELNYCIQYTASEIKINILKTYKKLIQKTNAPFSSLFSYNEINILSASPERFLQKNNLNLLSQPIKGTAKRGKTINEDQVIKKNLLNNQKEISENVMIVDLVRNDLSKIAAKNSVQVTELCKLYTFETVHQLISTVQAKLTIDINVNSIIKALFPMGSMTGAPKVASTKIIDLIENFKRGVYSGSIGFIGPNNSFDFNVVIRSILYNNKIKNLSISVGSAITIKSISIQEYQECLLKLKAIASALE